MNWLKLLHPKAYNSPHRWEVLFNQWLHQGFLWNIWSYDFYSKHQIHWGKKN